MTTNPMELEEARKMFVDGMSAEDIASATGKSSRTIRNWAAKYEWERYSSPEVKLEKAYNLLLEKREKVESDIKLLDQYSRQLSTLRKGEFQRRSRIERTKAPTGGTPVFYEYQQKFLDDPHLFRFVLKSRQIGFSYVIAWEALERALREGRDQAFISASFRQTGQIRKYVKAFARKHFGLKLRGTEVIRLPNDAEIHFLAANPATAQGFSGDIYFDEFFWVMRAREIFENAAAIATLGDYRITITSTPSVLSHYGAELWDSTRNTLDISRHLVTVIDAVNGGNTEIRLEKILDRFPLDSIRRLYMCEFVDDAGSVFTFDEIMACVYEDSSLFERRADEIYWGGVDVSRHRDDTSVFLLAVNKARDAPLFTWRHTERYRRVSLPEQQARLEALVSSWRPEELSIDQTTIGEQLGDAIQSLMPEATLVRFSAESKARLVINAQDVVRTRRLRIPHDDRLIGSFLAIKRKALETTVGYESDRNADIGHADDFWAIALAMNPAWGAGRTESFFMM